MHLRFLLSLLLLPCFCFAQQSPAIYHHPTAQADSPGIVSVPDTGNTVVPTGLAAEWKEQTLDGKNVVQEKGTVAFFNINGTVAGAGIYAFHTTAAKGSVIQVRNLNNGVTIYVKVLGPLPATKQYAGCILGLSGQAKAALGVRERKAFCSMSYAGY